MKRLFLAIVIACCTVGTAFCETVVAVTTVSRSFTIILEHAGTPLAMEVSVAASKTGKIIRQVTTDAKGRAQIRNLEAGVYVISSPVSDDEINVADGGSSELHLKAMFDRAPIEVAAVNGVVQDASGAVIPGAITVLEKVDKWRSPVAAETTNSSGSILLKARDGVYVLRVACQGFQTAVIPLKITSKGWPKFKLTLQVGGSPGNGPFTIKRED